MSRLSLTAGILFVLSTPTYAGAPVRVAGSPTAVSSVEATAAKDREFELASNQQAPAVSGALKSVTARDFAPSEFPPFDIVSIHRSGPQSSGNIGFFPTEYRAINVRLEITIRLAYFPTRYSRNAKIVNAPSWVKSELYDILAKVAPEDIPEWKKAPLDPTATSDIKYAMLQSLLKDRCKLKLHREPGEATVYALVESKPGSGIKTPQGTTPKLEDAPSAHPPMHYQEGGEVDIQEGGQRIIFTDISMARFTFYLYATSNIGTAIIDETHLDGRYSFTMLRPVATTDTPLDEAMTDPVYRMNSQLRDLGLKIVPVKVPLDTLVIDHIERPSPN